MQRFAARTEHPNIDDVTLEDLDKHKFKWDYLNENRLPQAVRIDATDSPDQVFNTVMEYLK